MLDLAYLAISRDFKECEPDISHFQPSACWSKPPQTNAMSIGWCDLLMLLGRVALGDCVVLSALFEHCWVALCVLKD